MTAGESQKDTSALVEMRNVYKSFGDNEVLTDISAQVQANEVVAIIGPSGSGKSTVLRCINGLEKVSSGSIVVDGVDLTQSASNLAIVRREVGMVFQQFNIFPHLTVGQNITLAPQKVLQLSKEEATQRARDLLEQVGLPEKFSSFPRQLSGGEQQRVAIARALAMQPKLMLFDEPTSALDPETIGEVLRVMRDLAEGGMTMAVVTHEIGFAGEVADRVLFMDHGEIADEGSAAEVLNNPSTERARRFIEEVLH